jgi:hypothetical protein
MNCQKVVNCLGMLFLMPANGPAIKRAERIETALWAVLASPSASLRRPVEGACLPRGRVIQRIDKSVVVL